MKKTKLMGLYLITWVFACICAVALRCFALLTSFNSVTMHFDGIAIIAANVIIAIAVVGFASHLILGEKDEKLIARADNAASFIPAGIVSTALLFMGVHLMKNVSFMSGLLRSLSIFGALLALLSVGSFFVSVFIESKNNIFKSAFSLSVVVFLALYSCYLYFNKEVHPTNSPNKLVDQMAYLFSAAFFLYEARIALGRARWRGYVSFGLMASLLCAYSAIPSLIVYAINGYVVSNSLVESVLTLTISVFITSKVLQTRKLTPDTECEEARSISALAAMREEEIEEERRLSRARKSNIMEENDDSEGAQNYTFDIPYIETNTDFDPEGADIDLTQNYSE